MPAFNLGTPELFDLVSDQPLRTTSLCETLAERARLQRSEVALTFIDHGSGEPVDHAITYGELDRSARQIATVLSGHAARGSRALLLYDSGLDYICAFMACLYAGVIAVPLYPPHNPRLRTRLQQVAQDCEASVALTTTATLRRCNEQSATQFLRTLQWIETDSDLSGLEHAWQMRDLRPDDCAFLQYTSGSSSAPKGVMVSHNNLLNNIRVMARRLRYNVKDSYFSWLPPYHDMGLIGAILTSVGIGIPLDFMSPTAFLRRPVRWLKEISKRRSTISGAPNFAFEMCLRKIPDADLTDLDLSSWTFAYSAAEMVRPETMRNFIERFAQCGFDPRAFTPCYGMAEATLLISGEERYRHTPVAHIKESSCGMVTPVIDAAPGERANAIVSCGSLVAEHVAVIVDAATLQPLNDNTIGELLVAGPSIAPAYWNRPAESAATFNCAVAGYPQQQFMRTGDLAFTRDAELYICGRLKDLIIIRGKNHYPHDLEASVDRADEAIRAGCGIAFSIELDREERLVFVQEVSRVDAIEKAAEIFQAMQQVLVLEHELQPYALVLIEPGTIPRTTSRKLSRRPCRDAYLGAELEVLATWINPAVQFELSQIAKPVAPDRYAAHAARADAASVE